MIVTVEELLASRSYPGRVCVAAVTADGEPVFAYALTGRSEASRSRTLGTLPDGDVEVRDTSGGPADALRHYVALAHRGEWMVVGNGEHVVPLAEALAAGRAERDAWQEHTFEPDAPIWTPRIWSVSRTGDRGVVLGWARRAVGGHVQRGLLDVAAIEPGHGLLLSTYDGTASDVRISAAPVEVRTEYPDAAALGDALWASLDADLRVAAFTTAAGHVRLLRAAPTP